MPQGRPSLGPNAVEFDLNELPAVVGGDGGGTKPVIDGSGLGVAWP
jgi:hypothetical protein